jgi:alpha-beta hydrolase superfamily lysophospholipase
MNHEESRFPGAGKADLYAQSWQPEEKASAGLAVVHGFGEHSGRYGNVVRYFVPRGFAVFGFDLRGHGRSPGQRGFIRDWSDLRNDTQAFLADVRGHAPGLPLFLYGHSLGGLIVLDYALHRVDGLQGVIATGPLLGPPQIPPILLSLSKLLSRVWPTLSLGSGLDPTRISRDPEVVRAYVDDPLVHSKGTPRLGAETQRVAAWVQDHATEWKLPLLIVHGADDRLAPAVFSREFFEKVRADDKERIEVAGGFHEPHNDLGKDVVFAEIELWLRRHMR